VSAEAHEEGAERIGPERVGQTSGLLPKPRRESALARLAGFLLGSWRELQRVHWPDRRQVMQATGVVLGFVIVAGVFLGVADLISEHLVKLILK